MASGTTLHSGSFTDRNDNTITVTFYQHGSFNVDPLVLSFSSAKEVTSVTVYSPNGKPTLTSTVYWITVGTATQSGYKYIFPITCSKNTGTAQRTTTLTASQGSSSKTVSVQQSAGSAPTPEPTTQYYFKVKVVDSLTLDPIPGASVSFYSSTSATVPTYAMTDLEGVASIEASSSSSNAWVSVSVIGYGSIVKQQISAVSSLGEPTMIYLLEESSGYWVIMNIQDKDGKSITGAVVTLYNDEARTLQYDSSKKADETGTVSWHTSDDEEQTFYYTVTATGYTTAYGTVTSNDSSTEKIVELTSTAGTYYHSIKVRNEETKEPIEGATVYTYDALTGGNLINTQTTGSTGVLALGTTTYNVAYYVNVVASGYEAMSARVAVSGSTYDETKVYTTIDLTEETPSTDTYYLNIHLTDKDGKDISSTGTVYFYTDSSKSGSAAYSIAVNNYGYGYVKTSDKAATTYYADCDIAGYTQRTSMQAVSSTTSSALADATEIEMTATSTTYYYGVTVTDGTMELEGATVTFYTSLSGTSSAGTATSDVSGHAYIKTTSSGYLYANAVLPGYTSPTVRSAVSGSTTLSYDASITLSEESTETTYYYTVHVTDGTNNLSGANVRMYTTSTGTEYYTATEGDAGYYTYSYSTSDSPVNLYLEVYKDGYQAHTSRYKLSGNTTATSQVLVEMRKLTTYYYGVEVTDGSNPISGATVTFTTSTGTQVYSGTTNSEGKTYATYSSTSAPTLSVEVTASGYEGVVQDITGTTTLTYTSIVLTEQELYNLDIQLVEKGTGMELLVEGSMNVYDSETAATTVKDGEDLLIMGGASLYESNDEEPTYYWVEINVDGYTTASSRVKVLSSTDIITITMEEE